MKSLKIDWPNHMVAFFSSLLGILIAFQLQNYAEERGRHERIETTLQSVKKEIEKNLKIYQYNKDTLGQWISYVDFYFAHNRPGMRGLILTTAQFDSLRQKFPERLEGAKLVGHLNDGLVNYQVPISIDVSPKTGISSSNWQAALSSGIVALLDHDTAAKITEVYYWTNIDIGQGDVDFYRMLVDKEIDNITEVRNYYKAASGVAQLKKRNIEKIVSQIKWD